MDLNASISERKASFSCVADDDIFDESLPHKERVIFELDRIEAAVERYRKQATIMEKEKDILSLKLDALQNSDAVYFLEETDKEEVIGCINRILGRFMTVDILITTNRNQEQVEALFKINTLINGLIMELKNDPDGTRIKCLSYLSACSSNPEIPPDKNFESFVLGCAMDDQKQIKTRLNGLLDYIDSVLK